MRLVLAVTFAVVVAGCSFLVVDAPGISRDEAIQIASSHVPANAELVSAEVGSSAGWAPLDEPVREAWLVRFVGNFPIECPAPAAVCPDLHNAVVALDFFTGEFLSTTYE